MFQRPKANSKGVSFGGPGSDNSTNDHPSYTEGKKPPTKKKKLKENSTPSSTPGPSKPTQKTLHTAQYQYQSLSPIVLGAKIEDQPESSLTPSKSPVRPESAPPVQEHTSSALDSIELTAETVIHFKKPTMREAANSASPYAPQTRSSTTTSRSTDSVAVVPPPWAKNTYEPGVHGLHQEISDFFEYLQPTLEERMLRYDLVERLRKTISGRWRQADVRFFGSFATELSLPTSDIDVVVLNVEPIQSNLWITRSLINRNNFASQVNVVAHAKVPLVKFTDEKSGYDVDISFDQPNGLRNTQVVNQFAAKYAVFRPLLLLLKYFLRQSSLNEPYNGGLGSYGLSLMLASFIQLHPKTNCATGETEKNLGFLLLDFLALYGKHFNYYNLGISVRGDGSYFNKFERGWIDAKQPYLISIEDPNDVSTYPPHTGTYLKHTTESTKFSSGTCPISCGWQVQNA